MNKITVILFFASQLTFGNAMFWSKTGHRAIGEVAQQHLNGKTKRMLKDLLDGRDLATVSNFADEIKADPRYREFGAWHYVNFPGDKKYTDVPPSEYGDLVMGIQKCIDIVKDRNSTRADKVFYLKMLIHFIGDLHQPMHIGRLEDKGGNDIQLQWFGKGTNLHKLWDSNMIDDYGLGYTELARSLPILNKTEITAMETGNLLDWVEESQEVANQIYDSAEVGEKLGYEYSYIWWGTVEKQLQKGGIRLAKVLNDLF